MHLLRLALEAFFYLVPRAAASTDPGSDVLFPLADAALGLGRMAPKGKFDLGISPIVPTHPGALLVTNILFNLISCSYLCPASWPNGLLTASLKDRTLSSVCTFVTLFLLPKVY